MIDGRPRRAVTVVFASLAALALAVGGLDPVEAQTDDPPGDASVDSGAPLPQGDLELSLIDQSFDVEPDADIELTYRITGDLETLADLTPPTTSTTTTVPATTVDPGGDTGSDDVPDAELPVLARLQVAVTNYAPVRTIGQLERSLGPDVSIPLLTDNLDGVLIDDVRPLITVGEGDDAGTAILQLSVPTDRAPSEAERLEFAETGLHPIVVEFRVDDEVVAAHGTIIDRRDDDLALPTVDLSLLTHIADPGPQGTLAELRDDIDALDRIADVAVEVDAPLTMSIPPNVARLASETSMRNDLPAAFDDDELISTPATPFDVSSATEVDRFDAFANQLTFGEDQLEAALPGTAVRRDAWLVTSPISADAAAELRVSGVRYMIMPPELYATSISSEAPATDLFVEIDLDNGSTMPILVIDPLGADLAPDATDEILDEMTATEWSIGTIAALRFQQYDAAPSERILERSRILATPDLSEPDPRLIVELERLARSTSAIRFSAASELTGLTDTQEVDDVLAFPEAAGPSLSERLGLINRTLDSLSDVASMLPEDDRRFADWQRQLDGFVSTVYDDQDVADAIDEILLEANVIRTAVIPPEPISFTLTGNEGTIDLSVGNKLDEPITVVLTLSSPRLTFPEGDQTITLPPNGFETVEIPVRARSNGTSSVQVDILTPSGEPLIDTVMLQSRVNALTGLGQALTAGLVLILLTWWFSNWRKKRRQNGAGDVAPAASA